eukprot:6201644-Pleurochrysis_carterae.AAC.1
MASAAPDSLEEAFSALTNLADDRLGAKVIFATDEWFAPAEMMLQSAPPKFDPDAFCCVDTRMHMPTALSSTVPLLLLLQGKVMDGWESRRRRLPGHDWCILELGLAGYIHGIEVDTAYFTGNQVCLPVPCPWCRSLNLVFLTSSRPRDTPYALLQVPKVRVLATELSPVHAKDGWLGQVRPSLGQRGSASSPEEIAAADKAAEAAGTWVELVPMSPLRPGYVADG